jgi:molybdenum cofactor cytidylyltransferase
MNASVRLRVAGVVLAAGRSSRMGSHNKLAETIGGKPIIARVAEAAIASGAEPVIVVTGFEAERIEAALRGLSVAFAHNPEFNKGMSGSLRTGLCALPPDCDGALILLGDMPEIGASDLEALMAAFAQAGKDAICVPVRSGGRGNPVLWGASYFAEMKQIGGDRGAKRLIAKYARRVVEVPVASDGIFADVDTQEELARLKAKLSAKL